MRIAVLFFAVLLLTSFNGLTEVETFRSDCFRGKIEITKTHADPGKQNGQLKVELPNSAGKTELIWVKHGSTEKGKEIKNLPPGYYNLMIVDSNNCQTVIDNILIKESQ
jgi:hypothetical protein